MHKAVHYSHSAIIVILNYNHRWLIITHQDSDHPSVFQSENPQSTGKFPHLISPESSEPCQYGAGASESMACQLFPVTGVNLSESDELVQKIFIVINNKCS